MTKELINKQFTFIVLKCDYFFILLIFQTLIFTLRLVDHFFI